jgi:hypothetical protein
MPALNQRDAIHYIASRKEFTASALSGYHTNYTPQAGRLNGEEYSKLTEASARGKFVYVVYSYGTPIALCTEEGNWHLVEQKFSPTTSKHQNLTRRAIADSLQEVN